MLICPIGTITVIDVLFIFNVCYQLWSLFQNGNETHKSIKTVMVICCRI